MIQKVLVYEPTKRMTPLQVIAHPFFDELRDENTRIPNGNALPDLFDFTEEEKRVGGTTLINSLVPDWYKKRNK
jgi:glycogen synthase kinase 3 beta